MSRSFQVTRTCGTACAFVRGKSNFFTFRVAFLLSSITTLFRAPQLSSSIHVSSHWKTDWCHCTHAENYEAEESPKHKPGGVVRSFTEKQACVTCAHKAQKIWREFCAWFVLRETIGKPQSEWTNSWSCPGDAVLDREEHLHSCRGWGSGNCAENKSISRRIPIPLWMSAFLFHFWHFYASLNFVALRRNLANWFSTWSTLSRESQAGESQGEEALQ